MRDVGAHLDVAVSRDDGVLVISAAGEIDVASAKKFGAAFVSAANERSIVVSLQGVRYVDSSGLTVLVRQHKRLRAHGGRLAVVLPVGPAARVFHITRLNHVLPCFYELADAIHEARGARGASLS